MSVGFPMKTTETFGRPHLKDDAPECDHVERRNEQCIMANAAPEASERDSRQIEARLVRKLDCAILPVLWIMYWFK